MASTNTPAKRSPKKAARTRSLTKAEREAAVESAEALHAALQAQVSGTDLRAAEPTDGQTNWGGTFRSWTTALYAWIAAKVSAVIVPSSSGTSTLVPDSSGNLDLTSVFGNYVTGLPDVPVTGASPTLAIGVRSTVAAGAACTAPAVPASVATIPARFAVAWPVAGGGSITYPNAAGTSVTTATLPGETLTFRNVGSGWVAESGNKTLTSLQSLFAPIGSTGSASGPLIYNGSSYPARSTATSSTTSPVVWIGPLDPAPSGALPVDIWENTGASI